MMGSQRSEPFRRKRGPLITGPSRQVEGKACDDERYYTVYTLIEETMPTEHIIMQPFESLMLPLFVAIKKAVNEVSHSLHPLHSYATTLFLRQREPCY